MMKVRPLLLAPANAEQIHVAAMALRRFISTSVSSAASKNNHHKHGPLLRVLPEVSAALSANRPVVALESTIIAHGMPYPQNLELSREVAAILRERGAVPATIAVRDGVCRVGLTEAEVADLAAAGGEDRAAKVSTRDLPLHLARFASSSSNNSNVTDSDSGGHQWGATTVASTMRLAHLAGISTFVTGGTGGVHRGAAGAAASMDVSADLAELARTPVVVVSAGVKSILDIKLTLEKLETLGVPAVAFGTDEFPAFFSPTSGVASPLRVDSAQEMADAYLAGLDLDLPNGMLVAVPNADPAGGAVEGAIQQALAEAADRGIEGRAVTPFILQRVAEMTGGDSLRSNMALVKNNARVGADIAVAIAERRSERAAGDMQYSFPSSPSRDAYPDMPSSKVVVVGGAVVDMVARPADGSDLILGTSNPGVVVESDGGVGRNVAEVLGRLGAQPVLFTAVGDDSLGRAIAQRLEDECGVVGADATVNFVPGTSTATYLAVMNSIGDLHAAIADMSVSSSIPVPPEAVLKSADIVVMDANAPVATLVETARLAFRSGAKVFFEPTSVPKAFELGREKDFLSYLSYAFPNVDELLAMAMSDGWSVPDVDVREAAQDDMRIITIAAEELLGQMQPSGAHLIITMGKEGVLLASKASGDKIAYRHFTAIDGIETKNSTGAGDTLCGAFVHALLEGKDEAEAVQVGMDAAVKSLACGDRAISPEIGRPL